MARKSRTPTPRGSGAEPLRQADTASNSAPPDQNGPPKPRSAWKNGLDFVVMLGCAVLAALVIKAYVFDVYLIPSGSMETALHGRPDGGDRIFCTKFNYRFRQPRRWEVAVFEFPYENVRHTEAGQRYKGQNFVKRIVGLPGETLVIGRGDIWIKEAQPRGVQQRMIKPDSVQRGMWLQVYEQDFRDITLPELEAFWRIDGGEADLPRGGPLLLSAVSGRVRMDYRAMVPAGQERAHMTELPGIPDRYTLEQPVQFRCAARLDNGQPCGQTFVKTLRTHNMQARCPRCGSLQDETSAIFYHRRSGLPAVGRYRVDPKNAPQGETDAPPRQADYHMVPDLRVRASISLSERTAALTLVLREDARSVQAVIRGDGQAEIGINGNPAKAELRTLADIVPQRTHHIEFYIVDGVARLFIDNTEQAVLEGVIWNDQRPLPGNLPKSSGVSLIAANGEIAIADLAIDRDIFYYSGWEREQGERFAQVNQRGEVRINDGCFFPMGDHTTSSYDARSWGPVPLSLLRGPALFIWWPPERIQAIPSPHE